MSFRIVPRVLGAARRALAVAERSAATSLASVSDNPVYLPPDDAHPLGRALSTGGYQNASAAPALDGLAGAWADLATLASRHATALLDGDASLLPHGLPAGAWRVSTLAYALPAVVEEARQAATRTPLPEPRVFDQNDVSVPTFLAWEKEAAAGRHLSAALAILAAVASQALFVTGRPPPAPLAALVDEVRHHFPPAEGPPHPGAAVGALADAFEARLVPPVPDRRRTEPGVAARAGREEGSAGATS